MLYFERDSDPLVSAPPVPGWKKSVSALWFLAIVFFNADRGLFPLALKTNDFSYIVQYSAAPYAIGAIFGLFTAAALYHAASARRVISLCLLIIALSYAMMATGPDKSVFLVLRLCSGYTAMLTLLYLPLWIEEFAPVTSQSKWMVTFAYIAPVLGTSTGYLLYFFFGLQETALILSIGFAACLVRLALSSSQTLQVPHLEKAQLAVSQVRMDSISSPSVQISAWIQEETSSSKNVAVLLGLVHAAATPLLLFSPKVYGDAAEGKGTFDLLICSLVAVCPFIGAILGAYVCNAQGGYKPGHAYRALRTLCVMLVLALLAAAFLFATSFSPLQTLTPVALGGLLIFLGSTFAPAAGVLMTSCPSYHRPASCAMLALLYQIFSYIVSPAIVAFGATIFAPAYTLSVHIFILLLVAVCLAAFTYANFPKVVVPLGLSGIDLQREEIEFEVSRRRILVSL